MPFCTNCGTQVSATDTFCGRCGARQQPGGGPSAATASAPRPDGDPFAKVSDRNAAILCYLPIVGWIPSIIVLASNRFRANRDIRFHAFQGLYLFVAWLLIDWVVSPMLVFGHWGPERAIQGLLHAAVFAAWIFMLVKTSQGQFYRLPIVGELAERSVAEQR